MRFLSVWVLEAVLTEFSCLYPTFTPAVTPKAPPPLLLSVTVTVYRKHLTYTDTSAACSDSELSAIASATDVLFSVTLT